MRFAVIIFLLSPVVFAQDAGQQAQQIAIQQTQQAQQDTARAMQQTSDASRQANQQAMDAARAAAATNSNPPGGNVPAVRVTHTPKFSPKPGTFKGVTPQVAITVATKGAVIYYTTDGSTPTLTSPRYTGPISLSTTTTLKATAIAPASVQSAIAQGTYVLK